MSVKIGDTLYRHDPYRTRPEDRIEKFTVVGETRVSWIVERYRREIRVSKSDLTYNEPPYGRRQLYTRAQIEELEWIKANRPKIIDCVTKTDNISLLRAIVAVIESHDTRAS
ncbi:hypothetical protein [Magnetospirillum molischianum]|uniref:Uncharacterized protein n=1 Tax=Magnetospirillum molischianum DSM 120 TaxID=1150626 RepID=H8FY78_MAGML|nr:hypothetical protein [Magnetospirillum molischianum]CCG43316.1 hypothetical protein PHAMO_80107 [Magnetospirillum molischianum DSM 120]